MNIVTDLALTFDNKFWMIVRIIVFLIITSLIFIKKPQDEDD